MSVLEIKGENILLCHKSTEQDKSLHVLCTHPAILCTAFLSFIAFKNRISATLQRDYIFAVCVLYLGKQ
jgi:hypothetical protein